jgi:hypothetical protein
MVKRNVVTVFSTAEAAASASSEKKDGAPIKNEQAYANLKMDEIVSLCKRRGIIFPSSDIYNGFAGFFDYGPLGAELKRRRCGGHRQFHYSQSHHVRGIWMGLAIP